MGKTVLFFPGQGSQYAGMARDLYDAYPEVRILYDLASKEIGDDIARISFEGPAEELKRTRYTQPAILLHSLAVLTVLGDNLPEFDYAAGHSLGEYGALAVTGALTYEHAIKAVVRRAHLMEQACQEHPSTMAAILGLDADRVVEICHAANSFGVAAPANFNSPGQTVISGEPEAVKQAVSLARDAGARRAVLLDVGGAFHSPLMESACTGMEEFLRDTPIHEPSQPVIANVTADAVTNPERIRRLLVQQIIAPVRWSETMKWLVNHDVTTVLEIGPGKVLSTLARREMHPENTINLDTKADVDAFVAVAV
ncbi:MAG: ACP S-malonyltransferase [Candidatus Zixiibacteriota bacterium]